MATAWKIGPKAAVCGILCGLSLAGWATRYSIAQDPAKDAQPPSLPSPDLLPPKAETPKPAPPQEQRETVEGDLAPKSRIAGPGDSLAVPSLNTLQDKPTPIEPSVAGAPAPVTVGPDHLPAEGEDPEKVASAFLEHNQKLAEAQLKSLREEAEKLRARLTKVEAGIKRWDRLLQALKQSQGPGAVEQTSARPARQFRVVSPAARADVLVPGDEPTELSPVAEQPALRLPQAPAEAARPADVVPR